MQSPELLEQTASERLTLEQEYDMQNSWFQDENSKPDCCELNPYIALSELKAIESSILLRLGKLKSCVYRNSPPAEQRDVYLVKHQGPLR